MVKRVLLLLCLPALLLGCRQETTYIVSQTSEPVTLQGFAMVDSYGTDSDVDTEQALEVDPYKDDGLFDIYWSTRRARRYDFYLSVSATSSIDDAVTVYDQSCSPGRDCDDTGHALCQYTTDFGLACGSQTLNDISPLITEIPQTLYFFAEACDIDTCSYQRLPVIMR